MIWALAALHIIVTIVSILLIRLDILKCEYIDAVVVFCVPVFGLIAMLIRSRIYRQEERKALDLELEQTKINDDVKRSIHVDDDNGGDVIPLTDALRVSTPSDRRFLMKQALYDINDSAESDDKNEPVVPITDALSLNDISVRRQVVKEALYDDPSGYITQLSDARENADPEVVHYAVTALVEIQKDYDLKYQKIMAELENNPDDPLLLNKYQNFLEKYIGSGLLEGGNLTANLKKYHDLLKKKLATDEHNLQLLVKKADAELRLEMFDEMRIDAEEIIRYYPENEHGYIFLMRYYSHAGNRDGINEIIRTIEEKHIYLSIKAKNEIEFWQN